MTRFFNLIPINPAYSQVVHILSTDIPVERRRLPESDESLAAEPRPPLHSDILALSRYKFFCNHGFLAGFRVRNDYPGHLSANSSYRIILLPCL